MKATRLYRLATAVAMLIVLANAWMAVGALSSLVAAESWRAHTLEVITHTEALALDTKTEDSAVRAFLLTGDATFEQRYREAVKASYAEVDKIQALTSDNSEQQDRIAYTRGRLTAQVAALDAGIAMRHGSQEVPAADLLPRILADSPDGGPTIAYCITQLETEEHRLLDQRNRNALHAQQVVRWSFIGASALDLLLIFAAASLLTRTLHDRQNLAARTDEIAALNAELTGLNSDLEARVAERTRELAISNQELEAFSYSVSHDLRAPLRTIDGFSLALQEDFSDKLDESGQDYIVRVRSGVQRMGQLIDALLQLSRVTRSELVADRVDLSQIVSLVFNELVAGEQQSGIQRAIALDLQPDVIVRGDGRLLRIAFENLMGNAFKFTSRTPDARIQFGTFIRDGETVYFLRDNGAGFDMQYVDRLFTAFQRLHGDREFKGSGIGLATVSRIIRRHHGTIWAEGEIGKGAAFFFTLGA